MIQTIKLNHGSFSRAVSGTMGQRHQNTLNIMLNKRIEGFQQRDQASSPVRYTSVILPLQDPEINLRINDIVGQYAEKLAFLLDGPAIDLNAGVESRHITLIGIKEGTYEDDSMFSSIVQRINHVPLDLDMTFHLAGLFFVITPDRGINIGIKAYPETNDDIYRLIFARSSIREQLRGFQGLDQAYLDGELERDTEKRGYYRTQSSILRFMPGITSAFGPVLGTPVGDVLIEAADPIKNYIGTINFSLLRDFVLRYGIGAEMGLDPQYPDLILG